MAGRYTVEEIDKILGRNQENNNVASTTQSSYTVDDIDRILGRGKYKKADVTVTEGNAKGTQSAPHSLSGLNAETIKSKSYKPSTEQEESPKTGKFGKAAKMVSETILGDEQGNTWLTYIMNPALLDGGTAEKPAFDMSTESQTVEYTPEGLPYLVEKKPSKNAEAFAKNLLYNFPGAKMVVGAVDKYIDPLLGTNLADSQGMKQEVQKLQEENKVASTVGALGGNLAGYYVGGQLFNSVPALSNMTGQAANTIANTMTGGKLSAQAVQAGAKPLQNIIADSSLDVALDVFPELGVMTGQGATGGEIAKQALGKTAENVALNTVGEAIPMAWDALKNYRGAKETGNDLTKKIQELNAKIPELKSAEELGGQSAKINTGKKITDPVEKAMLQPDVAQTHTAEELANMQEYLNAGDEGIVQYAKKVRSLKGNEKISDYPLSDVSERQAEDIIKLTGIDVSGNKVVLDKGAIQHIDNRHGVNGIADHSMADDTTLSRIQYVLDSYDEVGIGKSTGKLRTKDGKKSPTVVFQKKVDGQYYVVEAITDADTHTNRIVSAYTSTKKVVDNKSTTKATNPMVNADNISPLPRTSVTEADSVANGAYQMANADIQSPSPTSKNGFELTPNFNIPTNAENVKIPYLEENASNMTSDEFFDAFLAKGTSESKAEIPSLDNPKTQSSEYVTKTATNTLANSEVFKNNPEMQKILQDEINSGSMTFKAVTEDESIKAAQEAFKKDAVAETERLMSSDSWKEAKDFDGGMILLKSAGESGDYDSVRQIARKIASEGHDAGVSLQALSKYSKTAEGAIAKAQSIVDRHIKQWAADSVRDAEEAKRVSKLLVDEIKNMSVEKSVSDADILSAVKNIVGKSTISKQMTDDDMTEIVRLLDNGYSSEVEYTIDTILATQQYGISDETIEAVHNIFEQANKFGDDSKQRVELENKAFALLAEEVTTSNWQDKWDTWRYLSMLSKPATHERNIIGTVGMNVVSGVKNDIAAVMESAVDSISPKGIQRTKAVLNPLKDSDRALIKSAGTDADNVVYRALSGSKYGATSGIEGQAKAFRSGPGKLIQKLADKNSALLEAEDWIGLKAKYSTSLAGYLKANKADASIFNAMDAASKNLLGKAREYAIKEAKRATFHEDSVFADALSNFSKNMRNSDKVRNKSIAALIEGVMPFKKTPVNIVKMAGRYSPLGIADALFNKMPKALKKSGKDAGKYTAAEVLDSLASGLTGTGIMMLGAYLGSKGLIRGKGTGDEAQDSFDELRGAQNYALQIGDSSYTIDWLAPSVLPLLVGVELQKVWSEDGNIDASELFNSIASLADPIVETTMMSGISNALSSVRYAEDDKDILSTLAVDVLSGYATQGVPATLGAVARAVDNTRRDSSGENTGVIGQLEYTLNSIKNKIPFLSEQSPEYRDAWGRTQENYKGGNGNVLSNLAYQLFSPGYYSEYNTTPVDNYIQSLYDLTGESGVVPKKISRSYDGEDGNIRMSPEEYSHAQRVAGSTSYELIEELKDSNLSNVPKSIQAEIIPDLYSYAKAKALNEVVGKEMSGTNAKLADIYKDKGASGLVRYLTLKATADANNNGYISKDEAERTLNSTALSRAAKKYYFYLLNSSCQTSIYD